MVVEYGPRVRIHKKIYYVEYSGFESTHLMIGLSIFPPPPPPYYTQLTNLNKYIIIFKEKRETSHWLICKREIKQMTNKSRFGGGGG